MTTKFIFILFLFGSSVRSEHCSRCCTSADMQSPMTISTTPISQMKNDQCHVEVFDSETLNMLLKDKWLYFIGDSSTRGLALALFYELTNSKRALIGLEPNEIQNFVGFARSMRLFKYGDAATRAECKHTLVELQRAFRHSLDECDDFGDPCSPNPPEALVGEEEVLEFFIGDSVRVKEELLDETVHNRSVISQLTGEIVALGERPIVMFEDKDHKLRLKVEVPLSSLFVDVKMENFRRCKQMRGNTHSIASLHIGFLDAIICNGEIRYIKVSPHDYREGHMRAPLGAESFPLRVKLLAKELKDAGCVRITFRMLPEMQVLATELMLYAAGDEHFRSVNFEDRSAKKFTSNSTKSKTSYFPEIAGVVPDVIYLQGGAWDRALGCLARHDYVKFLSDATSFFSEAAPLAELILGTLPSGSAYPADPTAEMKRLADREKEPKMKEKVTNCLKFENNDPIDSCEHIALTRIHRDDAWILDRGVTRNALPQDLYEFDSFSDSSSRRLHPAMIQNVWDMHRLMTGLSTSQKFSSTATKCHCVSQMEVHNMEFCAPTTIMKKRDAHWPIGYPVKGRLVHWAVPCNYSSIQQSIEHSRS